MAVLVVPGQDPEPWPTLGPQVIQWMNENLVYGPGDIRGERLRDKPMDAETMAIINRAYEIHPVTGKRRFHRVALSMRKGTAKTEKLAWIGCAELHPEAPVRFGGWDAHHEPVGISVKDPYIPLVAYTEEQVDELLFGAMYSIISESPIADDFDIGLQRIIRMDGKGRAVGLAAAPNPRDGARTTWQGFDETHRFNTRKHIETHKVMMANVGGKRAGSEPWTGEATTAFVPGEGSVAEKTQEYAEAIDEGKIEDPQLFFFHRWASDPLDLSTREGVEAAVREASGPAGEWSDIERISSQWDDPTADPDYLERVWLNRKVMSHAQVFPMPTVLEQSAIASWQREVKEASQEVVELRGQPPNGEDPGAIRGRIVAAQRRADHAQSRLQALVKEPLPRRRTEITVGFDGSLTTDATGIIGTEIDTGYQFVLGVWQHPPDPDIPWECPPEEVDEVFQETMRTYKVVRAYCDPPYWETYCDMWAGKWPKKVFKWETRRPGPTAYAIRQYVRAWGQREVTHDGNPIFIQHLSNARKRMLTQKDEEGRETLYLMEKEHRGSPKKIDLAMAGMLSWEARSDAITGGALKRAGSKAGRTMVKVY